MDLGLKDKAVIVLGAATPNNMAQCIARAFAQEGARVMVAGRKQEPLQQLAEEIGGAWHLCDITSKADVEGLVDATLDKFGRLDVGINSTGNGLMKPFMETTTEELKMMCDVQFIGPFQFYQALIRGMTNGGSIIQITSATAKIMLDDHSPYRGTKAGADEVIRSIANEFGCKGIRANSVAPGLTDSPMAAAAYAVPAIIDLFNRESPMGRTGKPEDIAAACLFVASDLCFMTGETFQVNGGIALRRNPRQQEMIEAAMAAAG
nr:SDR family oxidoreductase [Sphingomonas sp. CDS-1]